MKNKNTNPLLHALLPVAAVIAYVLLGYAFKGRGWAAGWIVFLLIPIIESGVTAFKTKNPSAFAYPVLVTALFLTFGMAFSIWHPTWVLFVTIPAFYAICDYINRNRQQKAYENAQQNPNIATPPPFQPSGELPPAAPQVPPYQQGYYNPPKKSVAAPIAISIIFSITAIVIAAIIGFFSFLRGGFSDLVGIGSFFENNSSYTEINTSAEFNTDNINSLDIEWIDGNINIEYYDGEKIYIEENGGNKHPMCYKIDGGTLKIDEYRNKSKLVNINTPSKDLTVKLPLSFKADEIEISVVAANVSAIALNVGKFDFETVSGNGEFEFAASPREIGTESVSGGVKITLPSDVSGYSASFETVSGAFSAKDFDNSKYFGDGAVLIDGDSVSGNLTIHKSEAKTLAA